MILDFFTAYPVDCVLGILALAIAVLVFAEWDMSRGTASEEERTRHRLEEHHKLKLPPKARKD